METEKVDLKCIEIKASGGIPRWTISSCENWDEVDTMIKYLKEYYTLNGLNANE